MFVLTVIPLSRTAPGALSYRSAKDMPVGSIVHITLRKKPTQGIVVESVPVQEAKEMLKNARFQLLQSSPSAAGVLPEQVLRAAEETAAYHATTTGAVLCSAFAEHIQLGIELPTGAFDPGPGYLLLEAEAPLSERTAVYEAHISECSNEGKALLLVVPTTAEVLYWSRVFKKLHPLLLSGSLTGTKREIALITAGTHTGLIITTPAFSWVPVRYLGMIIIERISAGTYTLPKRPYLSMVFALQALARARQLACVIGDYPLPLQYRKYSEIPPVSTPSGILTVIDARRDPDSLEDPLPWSAVPASVIERIRGAHAEGKRIVICATRKGYAPTVICKDCGQSQTDDRGVPLTFTQSGGNRRFITSDGISEVSTSRKCPRCESWNLLPLGIGIERVQEELEGALSDIPLTIIASDTLASPAKVRKALAEAEKEGGMLLSTEGILPWLYAYPIPQEHLFGIIPSADSLLSLPFWRARERFIRLSYLMRDIAHETILVTRQPDDAAVDAAMHSGSPSFWEEETSLRTALHYPPFGTIVTLCAEGTAEHVAAMTEKLIKDLGEYDPQQLPFRAGAKGTQSVIVIMLQKDVWPLPALHSYLSMLSPQVRVRIDPESLW